jgi:RimJ/RimL family protein N-acetyltransferase
MPHPYTADDAADFVRRTKNGDIGKCVYAITNAENGAFIGCCGVEPHADGRTVEIGYWLGEPYWNKGYTTEACHALVDMVFRTRQDVDQIDARCRVMNVASRRVIQKCGFQFQGSGLAASLALGSNVPVEWYRLDRKTWMSLRSWGNIA